MKVILVDDEELALKRLELLLKERKEFEVVGKFKDGYEALKEINTNKPDLLFLDVNLDRNIVAFDLIKKFTCNPLIVFVTAYDEHAVKAFEYYALDFLLKPYKDDRFERTLDRALEQQSIQKNEDYYQRISGFLDYVKTQSDSTPKRKIPVRTGYKVQLISVDKIKYITASGYYSEIFTDDKKYVLRESIKNLIEQLKSGSFARIHRSTIINFDFIDELVYSNYGELDVKMLDKKLFRVSKGFKKDFFERIGI